jgi:hypothetical protein
MSTKAAHCQKCLPGARRAETKPCCRIVAADVQQVATPASIQFDSPAGRDLAAPADLDGIAGLLGADVPLVGCVNRDESPPPLRNLSHLLRL